MTSLCICSTDKGVCAPFWWGFGHWGQLQHSNEFHPKFHLKMALCRAQWACEGRSRKEEEKAVRPCKLQEKMREEEKKEWRTYWDLTVLRWNFHSYSWKWEGVQKMWAVHAGRCLLRVKGVAFIKGELSKKILTTIQSTALGIKYSWQQLQHG